MPIYISIFLLRIYIRGVVHSSALALCTPGYMDIERTHCFSQGLISVCCSLIRLLVVTPAPWPLRGIPCAVGICFPATGWKVQSPQWRQVKRRVG
jgi:hypothetical protein